MSICLIGHGEFAREDSAHDSEICNPTFQLSKWTAGGLLNELVSTVWV